jgi:acetyl esterase/lipase
MAMATSFNEGGVISVGMGAPNTMATLKTGVVFTDIDNGFARAHLKMDILQPDKGAHPKPTPVIVFVSGNGWRSIDRACHVPTLAQFARAGYLVASIEHRISGEAVYPTALQDVKTAVRFLRANAKTYNLDPARIGMWGNSAGGHLTAMAATTGDLAEFDLENKEAMRWAGHSSAIQAAVPWYAPSDLRDLPSDGTMVENVQMGFDVKNPANAARVGPASPLTYVSASTPPLLLVHGTADPVVPLFHSERLHQAVLAAGGTSTLLRVEGAVHSFGEVSSVPEVMGAMMAFFDKHLKNQ